MFRLINNLIDITNDDNCEDVLVRNCRLKIM